MVKESSRVSQRRTQTDLDGTEIYNTENGQTVGDVEIDEVVKGMNKRDLEKILNLLEGISLSEWKKLKDCIDREFNAQVNNSKFIKRDSFKKDLAIEFTQ